jgi:hypothetical protein
MESPGYLYEVSHRGGSPISAQFIQSYPDESLAGVYSAAHTRPDIMDVDPRVSYAIEAGCQMEKRSSQKELTDLIYLILMADQGLGRLV